MFEGNWLLAHHWKSSPYTHIHQLFEHVVSIWSYSAVTNNVQNENIFEPFTNTQTWNVENICHTLRPTTHFENKTIDNLFHARLTLLFFTFVTLLCLVGMNRRCRNECPLTMNNFSKCWIQYNSLIYSWSRCQTNQILNICLVSHHLFYFIFFKIWIMVHGTIFRASGCESISICMYEDDRNMERIRIRKYK